MTQHTDSTDEEAGRLAKLAHEHCSVECEGGEHITGPIIRSAIKSRDGKMAELVAIVKGMQSDFAESQRFVKKLQEDKATLTARVAELEGIIAGTNKILVTIPKKLDDAMERFAVTMQDSDRVILLAKVEIDSLTAQLAAAREEAKEAVELLADWCVRVDLDGTGWDDWDEGYKNARYRPTKAPGLRVALDAEIEKAKAEWDRY